MSAPENSKPSLRIPPWLRVKLPCNHTFSDTRALVEGLDLHTVCRPQPQVRARHRAFITHKGNLAVFRAKNFIAERLDLAFRDGFQPKGRCRDNF